jgi:hypothetical protein
MDNIIFDIDAWPDLVIQAFDLSGSEMADYSVFPVSNRPANYQVQHLFLKISKNGWPKSSKAVIFA